jgi:hypothetical protein
MYSSRGTIGLQHVSWGTGPEHQLANWTCTSAAEQDLYRGWETGNAQQLEN